MKRESKMTLLSIVGLLIVAVGLWGYQTFVVPKQEAEHYTNVYVANKDIPTNAKITEEMLTTVKVKEDSIVPGAITNSSEAVGKRVTGGILEGELVHTKRLSEKAEDEGELFIRVEPDYEIDISDGDHVRVFTLDTNGEMRTLFERKEVYGTHRVAKLLEGQAASGFYLLMTEQEVENYYAAKTNGLVVLSRIDVVATDEDVSNGTGEPIVFENDGAESSENVESSNRYTVQEGQTLEDIAFDIETSPEVLTELNDGLVEVNEGDVIVIP